MNCLYICNKHLAYIPYSVTIFSLPSYLAPSSQSLAILNLSPENRAKTSGSTEKYLPHIHLPKKTKPESAIPSNDRKRD